MAANEDRIVVFLTNVLQGKTKTESYAIAFEKGTKYDKKQVSEQASRYFKRKDVQIKYKEMSAKVEEESVSIAVGLRKKVLSGLEELFDIAMGKEWEHFEEKIWNPESEKLELVTKGVKKRINFKIANEIAANINKMEGYNQERQQDGVQHVTIVDDIQ